MAQSCTHFGWISFPHYGQAGDKPESYPRVLGITYPHSLHRCFSVEKVIPIDLIFIHRASLFIPTLSTCGWLVDKLSTTTKMAFLAHRGHLWQRGTASKWGLSTFPHTLLLQRSIF